MEEEKSTRGKLNTTAGVISAVMTALLIGSCVWCCLTGYWVDELVPFPS
ncbi:MAG: hypothetical protein AAGE52_18640 [Myxococcota bacterium]